MNSRERVKEMKKIFYLFIIVSVILISCNKNTINHKKVYNKGIYNENGVLKYDGKPFHGIGVNYYDLFARVLNNPNDKTFIEGLKRLSKAGILFVRFRAGGFTPEDWEYYRVNKEEYFTAFDMVVKEAEKQNIGLIPSFFWTISSVPVMVGELVDEFGNDESKTIAFIKEYTHEVVERYTESPAIWAWEFGNENNLWCDMPVEVFGFKPGEYTQGNMLSGKSLVNGYQEFAKVIRKYDKDRIIITGNSEPRRYIWNNINGDLWKTDTEEQYREILLRDNPDEINTISIRGYYYDVPELPMNIISFSKFLSKIKQWSDDAGKPIFVGEFGAKEPYTTTGKDGNTTTISTEQAFQDRVDAILENKIQLSALWVYDFDEQNESSDNFWNVTFSNSRSYMLDAIIKANNEFRMAKPRKEADKVK